MQLEQNIAGHLIIRIVPGSNYGGNDEREMVDQLRKSVSNKIKINCEYVERIEKTHRDKHRFLIQKVEKR